MISIFISHFFQMCKYHWDFFCTENKSVPKYDSCMDKHSVLEEKNNLGQNNCNFSELKNFHHKRQQLHEWTICSTNREQWDTNKDNLVPQWQKQSRQHFINFKKTCLYFAVGNAEF